VSVIRDSENWVEDALRAWASVKREEVRFADSTSLAAKRSGSANNWGSAEAVGDGCVR